MKTKVISIAIIFLMLLSITDHTARASLSVSADNAIVIEQESGRVLFEKRAHEKKRIASITKIMTAILAIESDKLLEMATASEKAIRAEGSSIYLMRGEKLTLEDLVYGLMLRSGNDAAVAIAEHVGGSLEGFVFLMNQKAAEIGMMNTNFANPHGLDDSNEHYSTAYDMALLTKYAMKNNTYREIAGTKTYRSTTSSEKVTRSWTNKNRLLTGLYEYSTGGKTGFTKLAKRTLVSTATKGDLDLIAVTLNAPSDWNDHIAMFELGFDHYELVKVIKSGVVKEIDHPFYKKRVYFENDFYYPITEDEKDLFHIDITLTTPKKDWDEMRNIPETVGKAVIYFDNEAVKEMPIYFNHSEEEPPSMFERFKSLFGAITGMNKNG